MSKTAKQTGTKASTAKPTPKERVANRAKKIAAKHEATRKASKPADGISMEQKVVSAADEALARPAAGVNPLISARGSEFTDALNAASVAQLEEALKHPGMSNQYRNRIGIALELRTTPADDVARTVAAVEAGDLTKGVEVPTGHRAAKGRDTLAPAASRQDGSTKDATAATERPTGNRGGTLAKKAKADGKMSGLAAAALVLAESPTPLNAKQIIEQAAAKGYWTSPGGKTPAATIYAAMATEAKKKGAAARFVKVDRGQWTLTGAGKQAK